MKTFNKIIAAVFLLAAITGCMKTNPTPAARNGELSVQLTEKKVPENYSFTRVNLNIEAVDVQYTKNLDGNWTHLETKAGIYNLLELQNSLSATLAAGKYPEGTISAVRIVLGEKNSVFIGNDMQFPLFLSAEIKEGIVIYTNTQLSSGNYLLLLVTSDLTEAIRHEKPGYVLYPSMKAGGVIK